MAHRTGTRVWLLHPHLEEEGPDDGEVAHPSDQIPEGGLKEQHDQDRENSASRSFSRCQAGGSAHAQDDQENVPDNVDVDQGQELNQEETLPAITHWGETR